MVPSANGRLLILAALVWLARAPLGWAQPVKEAPELADKAIAKAIAYLAAETPKWRPEHRCASCHHQGSASRALLVAKAKGKLKNGESLENSLEWLEHPEKWADNHGDPNASDPLLAEIQFGASLFSAEHQNPQRFHDALAEIAKQLAKRQAKDGSFVLENSEGVASPITLGPILLTAYARAILVPHKIAVTGESPSAWEHEAKLASKWLLSVKPRNTFEGSSLLIALTPEKESKSARAEARKIVLASAHPGGGFGPYVNSPAEVFDTALAILALSRDEQASEHRTLITNAKKQLIKWQLEDGSWEETTRPSGGISYAHRISTTAWALEALLE